MAVLAVLVAPYLHLDEVFTQIRNEMCRILKVNFLTQQKRIDVIPRIFKQAELKAASSNRIGNNMACVSLKYVAIDTPILILIICGSCFEWGGSWYNLPMMTS